MRVWIRAERQCEDLVELSPAKSFEVVENRIPESLPCVCRKYMAKLIRGSGKTLPKHGTDGVITVNLRAEP